jgi:hypothetical protein
MGKINIQGRFREHSGNIQGTFREHPGNIQGTFSEHSVNTQGTFSTPYLCLVEWEYQHSGTLRENQETFSEHSGKIR